MTQMILPSGGVESATLLEMETAKDRPQPVFADYGQRAHSVNDRPLRHSARRWFCRPRCWIVPA